MDLNDYWQENRRFLTAVGIGAVTFFIARAVIQSVYGEDLRRQQRTITRAKSDLAAPRFGAADLSAAQEGNDVLRAVVEELKSATTFEAREGFRLDPTAGSASNQYFDKVSSGRESLMRIARRSDLRLPEDLGLPALSPTREPKIVRFLEAFDVVDRVARLAIEVGLERIEKINIALDPALDSSRGVGELEKTKIEFRLSGNTLAIARLLSGIQDGSRGQPLVVEELEMRPERSKNDEARADLTLVVPRLHVDLSGEAAP